METFDRASLEYVRVRSRGHIGGADVDPTGDAVKIAVVKAATHPADNDYVAGSWETDATTTPPTYYARRLVDFAALVAALTLTPPAYCDVYVWITDNPEQPRKAAGTIMVG